MSVERLSVGGLKKIAIYGGTFDPVHHAHLILAREAIETLDLDKVILVPAAISPLKKAAPVASGEVRLAMLQAAIKGEPKFEVDECELLRPPPSYTIDTVEEIRRRECDASIYCLIGEDNVEQLPRWHRFAELEKIVRFVVLDRTGKQPSHSYQLIHRRIDISATEIRRRVAQNESIRYLVPDSVERNYSARKTLSGAIAITPENLAKTCAELASNKKAEDIVVLDLRGISSFTDFFVICSGTSEPQLKAIANEIETRLREDYSLRPVAVDGFPASQWMVLDYLQVVVHIFHRDKRAFYSLEGLWGDAPVLQWESISTR